MSKQPLQKNKKKRAKKHGFMARMETSDGRKVIARRRAKNRQRLTVSDK